MDDSIFYEIIDMDKGYDEDPFEAHIQSSVYKYCFGYCFNWPYFSYIHKQKYVYVYNAFNPSFVQCY